MLYEPYFTKIKNSETSWCSAPIAWDLFLVILWGMMGSEVLASGILM